MSNLRTASASEKQVESQPVILVIFGITGDLSQRKLLPALYHLLKDGLLHPETVILGITRQDTTAGQLLEQVELCVNEVDQVCDPVGLQRVRSSLRMHRMSLDEGADYDGLRQLLDDIETEKGICMNRLFYLSVPPKTVQPIVAQLGRHGLNASCGPHGTAAARLLVEKPFGYDTASAEQLIKETGEWFSEDQLFRIDHYVAKETVQNILAFRHYNPVFHDLWDGRHIARIEVTAYEQLSIEGRAAFYEGVGALRDFVQNHLLQLLTAVTMELPDGMDSPAIHRAKLALLQAIQPPAADHIADVAVRGQYQGYPDEVGKPDSTTETYASLTLSIDNDRWRGVPLVVRTGKAMDRKQTDIRILFHGRGQEAPEAPNELLFHIQPDEGISLRLNAKKPGYAIELQPVIMNFSYDAAFGPDGAAPGHPDAYERVLADAARGDHTLFTTSQEVLAAWRIVEPVLNAWNASGAGLIRYPKGSQAVGAAGSTEV